MFKNLRKEIERAGEVSMVLMALNANLHYKESVNLQARDDLQRKAGRVDLSSNLIVGGLGVSMVSMFALASIISSNEAVNNSAHSMLSEMSLAMSSNISSGPMQAAAAITIGAAVIGLATAFVGEFILKPDAKRGAEITAAAMSIDLDGEVSAKMSRGEKIDTEIVITDLARNVSHKYVDAGIVTTAIKTMISKEFEFIKGRIQARFDEAVSDIRASISEFTIDGHHDTHYLFSANDIAGKKMSL